MLIGGYNGLYKIQYCNGLYWSIMAHWFLLWLLCFFHGLSNILYPLIIHNSDVYKKSVQNPIPALNTPQRLRSPPFGFWVYFTAWDLESCNRQSERRLVLSVDTYTQHEFFGIRTFFNELPDTSEAGPHWKPHVSMNIKEAFRMLKLLRWLLCTSCFAAESASETLEFFHWTIPQRWTYQNRRRRVHFAKMARILVMKKNNWPDKEKMMINHWLWMIYHVYIILYCIIILYYIILY